MSERDGRIRERALWYERARFEDAPFPPWDVRRWPAYLAKYWLKRPTAPAAVVRHFDAVRQASRADQVAAADFTLAAVGDILWMRRGYEDFISPSLRPALKADVLFGNLETPVAPSRPVRERMPDVLRSNAPPALLDTLARHGFDVLSVVNNHCLDQGTDGLRQTVAQVRERGMQAIEAGTCERLERRGVRVAFLGFAAVVNPRRGLQPPAGAVVRPNGEGREPFLAAVRAARRRADLVVVSAHWGYEHEYFPDRRQAGLARALVAAGADLILGHHPHILQPVEFIPRRAGGYGLVCYSLGNFASVMYTLPCRVGAVARVGFSLDARGPRISSVEFVPTMARVRRHLRTQVLPLGEARRFMGPTRVGRAQALLDGRTARRLIPPNE
jgi:hypothetical protein